MRRVFGREPTPTEERQREPTEGLDGEEGVTGKGNLLIGKGGWVIYTYRVSIFGERTQKF